MPRWVKAKRVTFKYGLGDEFIDVLKTLHKLGLDRTEPVTVRSRWPGRRPRDVVAAMPARSGRPRRRMHGSTCAGLWVTGTGKDGRPREVYLYHVVDNATMARVRRAVRGLADRGQSGRRAGAAGRRRLVGGGRLGPEAFEAVPFLDLLAGEYESPWGLTEMSGSQRPLAG